MKVILINGSPNKEGCTYTALKEVSDTLNKHNIDTEIFYIGKMAVSGCMACNYCREHFKCCINDKVNELTAKLPEIDGVVVGTPVHYASASGMVTSFLDRAFRVGFLNNAWANKLGAPVVSCRRGGATAAFDQINKYFTMNNMPVVSSQYWNQVHGSNPEEVRKDLEGMQTMRTLANNMAWLLKCIEAGKKAGIPLPELEPRIFTNFIR